MSATKLMWAFLLNHGKIGTASYYGGSDVPKGATKEQYLCEIDLIGVDWNKTKEPESDREAFFQGTFNEPSYSEVLTGKLVLKSGIVQEWYCANTRLEDFVNSLDTLLVEISGNQLYRD